MPAAVICCAIAGHAVTVHDAVALTVLYGIGVGIALLGVVVEEEVARLFLRLVLEHVVVVVRD